MAFSTASAPAVVKNTLENLVITPHIGGMSKAAQKIAYNRAVDLLENNFIVKHF